ncbi:MAG: MmcQ/YjbR family DNA-binding protein [Bacteroidota bacterium]
MDIEELRQYCLRKAGVTEEFPFDESTLVFKVMGKMFLLTPLDETGLRFNVKCDPEVAISLRESHPCVSPGFHMNKASWNTVDVDGSVPDRLLHEWIDHSYSLVIQKLPKKTRITLETFGGDPDKSLNKI